MKLFSLIEDEQSLRAAQHHVSNCFSQLTLDFRQKTNKKNKSQTLLSFYNISDLTKADYYFLSSLIYKDTKLGIKYYKLR